MSYYLLYTLNALLMLVPPILLGVYLARKWGMSWSLYIAGAVTFIISQIGHLPFNDFVQPSLNTMLSGLPNTAAIVGLALFLGVSAGVFEEVARYLTYAYWRKDARTWARGMMLGAGHGGVESLIVGLRFAATFILLSAYDAGLAPNLLATVPADQLPEAQVFIQAQIQQLHDIPWYGRLLGGIERLFAITLHLSLSLLVMQCFTQGKRSFLLLAIGWHALANAGAVILIGTTNEYVAELFLAIMALLSLFIIRNYKRPEPVEPEPEPLPPLKELDLSEVRPTDENLERSRYV
jgi:uncharacterized membrane protein YhfC